MSITQPDLSVFETLESEVRSYCRPFPTVFDRGAQGTACATTTAMSTSISSLAPAR